jgi:N-methylhydantoinase A
VIEMIEIGAGGGSIAWVDAMGRIQTGPESAGSEPGPACYGRGGLRPAITDADLVLGKLDPDNFAGGKIRLSVEAAGEAIARDVAGSLRLDARGAAFGITEVVDENMANAARVHAVENGKNIGDNVMIAFGGAAPLHAARLCEKLGIDMCLVPKGAGVGSAIGFLRAPFGYEALTSRIMPLSGFDATAVNAMIDGLKAQAERFVREGARGAITCEVTAFMRYAGQGWEIPVSLPDRSFAPEDAKMIEAAFRARYVEFFGRAIDGPEIEFVTWSVKAQDARPAPERVALTTAGAQVTAQLSRAVFDPTCGADLETAIFARDALMPGARVSGPAVIVEEETSTLVSSSFDAVIQPDGTILLLRKGMTP